MCVETLVRPQHKRVVIVYFVSVGVGVQLVSMWRADGLMKIDSNYVELRLTARNDDEGSRILMSFV